MLATRTMPRRCEAIAAGGADAFYTGPIAADIVAAVRAHPTNPGRLSLADLAAYKVKERPAVCAPYRGYEVCGMGPPSSGALPIGQILGMLEPFDLATLGPDDPEAGASSATPRGSPSPTASATSPTAISCRSPRACSIRPI